MKLSKQLTELDEQNITNEQARQQLHQFIFNFNQSVSPDLNINPIGQGLSLENQLMMEGLNPKNSSFLSGKGKDQTQDTDLSKLHGSLMEKKTAVEDSKQFGSQLHNTSAPRKSHAYNLEDSLMTSARVETYNEPSQLVPRSLIHTGVADQSKNTSQMPQDPITEENSRESNNQHSNVNILNQQRSHKTPPSAASNKMAQEYTYYQSQDQQHPDQEQLGTATSRSAEGSQTLIETSVPHQREYKF